MPETMSQDLAAALRELANKGYELTFSKPRGSFGYLVHLVGPLGSTTTGIGDDPAAAVASVWPLDVLDDDQAEDEPYCVTCGAPVGIFYGHGEDWHH
ncbi:MAG TPA: hypothetical protein VFQ68_13155 [Streptosporangiaceae bacterium]|nr:hypothetical protein [Streptosporangiaceae bacterium]